MTTQELKQYIDKVLGNSIRCLLPSYWWKRLFSLTLEKVDEKLDATNIKTINGESIVGEGDLRVGVKSVESVEALEKLDAKVADIAIVGYESLNLVSVGSTGLLESVDDIVLDWDKLTRIVKVEQGVPYSNGSEYVLIWLHGKSEYGKDLVQLTSREGEFYLGHYSNITGIEKIFTFDSLNTFLQENEYRLIGYRTQVGVKDTDNTFKIYTKSVSADAYIKGDSWEMLTKENVVNSEDELDGLDVPYGSIAKVNSKKYGKINPYNCYRITSMSSSDIVKINWYKLKRITQIDVINPDAEPSIMPTIYLHGYANLSRDLIQISYYDGYKVGTGNSSSTTLMSFDELNSLLKNSDYRLLWISDTAEHREFFDKYVSLYSPDLIAPNAYIKGDSWERLAKESDLEGVGASITVDTELSDTSKNPVQNKVLTEALGILEEHLAVHSKQISSLGLSMATKTDVDNAIANAITATLNTAV